MTAACLPRRLLTATLLMLALGTWHAPGEAQERPVIVFAAASLKTALDEVAVAWQRDTGHRAAMSYAGTAALAHQIDQGAPADLVLSADTDWMDYLGQRGLVDRASRADLLGNRLVLVAPRDSRVTLRLTPGAPLAAALDGGRLAVANVVSVPAGRYAKAALESLGLWRDLARHLVQTDNVRAALRLVERGEAPLGVVYATDARAEPGVRVVDLFDQALHPPIRYPVARVRASTHPEAQALLDYLRSPAATRIFEREGFAVLPGP